MIALWVVRWAAFLLLAVLIVLALPTVLAILGLAAFLGVDDIQLPTD